MAERGLNYRIKSSADVAGLKKGERALRNLAKATKTLETNQSRHSRAMAVANGRMNQLGSSIGKHTARVGRHSRAIKRQTSVVKRSTAELTLMNTVVRRLLVSWGVFYAAMAAQRGFRSLIGSSIDFNRQIEQSQLGIAALITASARIEDSFGRAVSTTRAFAFAQGEARRQVQLLRKDALATEATYQQLLETFQVAIAPGLMGGMALDDIRIFALRISQAATALAMPQRQLAEEIRSILQGSIRVQNTRIAAALGITNEHVRRWKTMGTLTENLVKRFEAFKESGKELKETFAGISGRVMDAFQQLAGEGGRGLFDEVKSSLKDMFQLIVDFSKNSVIIRPEAIVLAREFFKHIRNIVVYAKQMAKAMDFNSFKSFLDALGGILEFIGKLFVDIGAGVARAFATLGAISNAFGGVLGTVKDLRGALGNVVTLITELLVLKIAFVGIKNAVWGVKVALLGAKAAVGGVGKAVTFLRTSFFSLVAPLVIAGTIVVALNKRIQKMLGTDFSAIDQVAVAFRIAYNIVKGIFNTVASLGGIFMALGVTIDRSIGLALKAAASVALYIAESALDAVAKAQLLAGHTDAADTTWKAMEKLQKQREQYNKEIRAGGEEIAGAWKDGFREISNAWKDFDLMEGVDEIMEKGGAESGKAWVSSFIGEVKGFAGEGIGGLLKDLIGDEGAEAGGDRLKGYEAIADKLKAAKEEGGGWLKGYEAIADKLRAAKEAGSGGGEEGLEIGKNYAAKIQEMQDKLKPITQELQAQEMINRNINEVYSGRISQLEREIVGHQGAIAAGISVARNEEDILVKRGELVGLQKEMPILLYQSAQALERIRAKQAILVAETQGGWGNSIKAIALDLQTKIPTALEVGMRVMETAIKSFASTISSVVIDAFDPDKSGGIKEKFAMFLKGLSSMIIQELVKIAMMKTMVMIGLSGAGGMHSGGRVGGRLNGGQPSLGHMFAPQGLADGGAPAGLHHSDTIPIWAAPGEFMMKVDAVKKYGSEVMGAINQGLIDPSALRSLAGVFQRPTRKAPAGRGFAEGGNIADTGSGEDAPTVIPAAIVASDDAMDRLLAGGSSAMMSFIQDNSETISHMLKN